MSLKQILKNILRIALKWNYILFKIILSFKKLILNIKIIYLFT